MRTAKIAASLLSGAFCLGLAGRSAQAQVPPIAERDTNWDAVSNVTMMISVATVSLMPRVYYSSPDATVGWKARWHVSALAPIMSATALTLFVDGPIRNAVESVRPGCTLDETKALLPDSGCESFGGPSTQAYAAWGATGAGVSIFLVDTFKYSDSELNIPYFAGEVLVPFSAAMVSSISRSQDGYGIGHESFGQVLAGALTGAASGLVLGLGYSLFQEPDCGYGGYLFCW
ncbi:MAG: hypothetical protein HY744_28810 [Deltaproteobacteria bacterium]|nr:hypothetical protein [Deltaproteobacteria bacterium]